MKFPLPLRGLSIFGRTFLLMLAALAAAEGIGVTLLITRPPLHNAPVLLSEVARHLSVDSSHAAGPRPPFNRNGGPPPRPFSSAAEPPAIGGPPQLPPNHPRPLDGDGPPRPPDFVSGWPPNGGEPPQDELVVRTSATAPAEPQDVDRVASESMRRMLAALVGDEVVIYVGRGGAQSPRPGGSPGEIMLREGFTAARRLPDGRWRIVESVVQGFPNAFHQQAMLLFALGLAALLPLAWLFATALSAPIRRFSAAAQRVGTDPHAAPLPVEGPAEMLLAIESFNAMQARLHRLLQERTQMIAAIAHDLRTPLTRLAFRLDNLPAPLTDRINADIQEMTAMISAALDYIRERSLNVRRERLDFRLLVESVVDDQSDIGCDAVLEHGAPITVEGDPLALKRAVVNLVENAVKYGKRARLRLFVGEQRCTLEVDDDGPGIPEALHSRVFEPFFRVDNSRNRDTGGVGLGLAVVRGTVVDHGGDVSLHNRLGGGLRVNLWLPLAREPAPL